MPYQTLASGLTIKVPTRGTRGWAQTFLDECFKKISAHDHTTGKGLSIGASALSSNAVSTAKIVDSAVTVAKLAVKPTCPLFSGISYPYTAFAPSESNAFVPYSDFTSIVRMVLPKACSVTHITVQAGSGELVEGGSLVVKLLKNNADTGSSITFNSGGSKYGAITPVSFVAGDLIALQGYATNFALTVFQSVAGIAWGHFTE